jgi:hypothetical protein
LKGRANLNKSFETPMGDLEMGKTASLPEKTEEHKFKSENASNLSSDEHNAHQNNPKT